MLEIKKAALQVLSINPCRKQFFKAKIEQELGRNLVGAEYAWFQRKAKEENLLNLIDGKFILSSSGRLALGLPKGSLVEGSTWNKMTGDYLCPELGRTCQRQGAYDFLDIPSRFCDVRKPYKFKSGV